jgi:hypothetical protein
MPANYYITEPAPSTTSFIRSGRGGAGNTFRAPATSSTHRVSNNAPSSSNNAQQASSARRFFSGVGGAGNAHKASERPAISLDDEVRRLAARDSAAQSGHCGIGGAGNVYRRKASDAGSSSSSSEDGAQDDGRSSISSVSSKAKLWARMTGKEY